jgi:hypothetical protein
MVSKLTRIPINAVTGRVNAMLPDPEKDFLGLVHIAFERVDPGGGAKTPSEWIELVTPEPKQREFKFP